MIRVSEIIGEKGTLGISFQIGKEKFFIASDQETFPGITTGSYPRSYDRKIAAFKDYDFKTLCEIPITGEGC